MTPRTFLLVAGLGLAPLLPASSAWTQKVNIDVSRAIAALKDPSPSVREGAAGALGALGPAAAPATEALLYCLDDKDPYVSGKAAEALSRVGPPAVAGLIRTLRAGGPSARWSATIALAKMGPGASPALPALVHALTDSSDLVRWGSAVALGNIGPHAGAAVSALLNALHDRDEDVRREASRVIDRLDPSGFETPPDWETVAAIVDTLVPRLMRETRVPGVSIALISDRKLVWSSCYGVANAGSGKPVTEETMFEACSMSKPVFAYLAMMLAEKGRLDLDKPLAEYLELACLRGQHGHERITARMALSHTSGLPNWRKGEEERDGPLPLLFTPGTMFSYSGEGIFYLQKVVEQITGEPLDSLAQRMLFTPLSLKHTSFAWEEKFDDMIAGGHDTGGHPLGKTRYTHANAAYSLYVSAEDYTRFLLAILSPPSAVSHLLTQPSLDTMLSRQVVADTRKPVERPARAKATGVFWGLGWCINSTPQGDIALHSGSNRSGFRCFSQFSPSRGTGLVIMTNGAGGTAFWERLVNRIGNF